MDLEVTLPVVAQEVDGFVDVTRFCSVGKFSNWLGMEV